jgi:hypothetical protein
VAKGLGYSLCFENPIYWNHFSRFDSKNENFASVADDTEHVWGGRDFKLQFLDSWTEEWFSHGSAGLSAGSGCGVYGRQQRLTAKKGSVLRVAMTVSN